jgi:hypothetical protein
MRTGIFLDYANLYHAMKDDGLSGDIHSAACQALEKLINFIAADPHLSGMEIVTRQVAVLDAAPYRTGIDRVQRTGWRVELVPDAAPRPNAIDPSRPDDGALKGLIQQALGDLDAVMLVSDDGGFAATANMIRQVGRKFFAAGWNSESHRTAIELRRCSARILALSNIFRMTQDDLRALAGKDRPERATDQPAQAAAQEAKGAGLSEDPADCIEVFDGRRFLFTFPLNHLDQVDVGRRSQSMLFMPHLDLTDYDPGRVVSRRHLSIRRERDRYWNLVVLNGGDSATWKNGECQEGGGAVRLVNGDVITLGHPDGLSLKMRLDDGRRS